MNTKIASLEELRRAETATKVACDESDNEPCLVERYLLIREQRMQAEQKQASLPAK